MNVYRDKVAFVTGAAFGIGRALCRELATNGAGVIATDIDEELLEQAMETSSTQKVKGARLDVTDYEEFKKLIEETISEEGRLDYLFNNAGIAIAAEVRDVSIDHWRKVLDVNLNGVVYGSTLAYQFMAKQGSGHIVNLVSVEGLLPFPVTVSYVTSKFAVVGLSQGLWVEGADLGVKVSAVCPAFVWTPILDNGPVINFSREDLRESLRPWLRFAISPEACAHAILKGVARKKRIITVSWLTHVMWWLTRISPALFMNLVRGDFRKWRGKRGQTA